MKDELGGEIITEFIALRPKIYSYLTDNDKKDKKAKGTKKCVMKKMIKFDDYKKCLLNDKVILKSQQRFISTKHDVYTEDVNKIALSNDHQYHQIKLRVIHMDINKSMKTLKGSVGVPRSNNT